MKPEFLDALAESAGWKALQKVERVGGGSINECFRVESDSGMHFLKVNRANRFPKMFELECDGLTALGEHSDFVIPSVQWTGTIGDQQALVMDWLPSKSPTISTWRKFGKALAAMHSASSDQFGWHADNYIGSLVQRNTNHSSWAEFFAQERLLPQAEMAMQTGLFTSADQQRLESVIRQLPELFEPEPPAMLHGDLWSGNYLFTSDDAPALFDPAVYFGHRLMDIGMLHLFGGVADEAIQSYNEAYPLQNDWQRAMEVANLYPLLVHLNLFGFAYISQIRVVLSRF